MSMVINLVEDHNIYLCEGGPVYNGGVQPTPITYLTQWKIVGNSEVHTLPYTDIPQGYTKCKYLEFHGTEWIDSGVLTKNDIGFRCQYSTTEANKSMFGAQSKSGDLFLFSFFTTNTAKTGYGGASTVANINTNPIDGNRHTLTLDSEQCKIDNESVVVKRRAASLFYNVFIGTHNVVGTADSRKFIGKIYVFELYDSNGELFNGIPCLDDNDVPCLYDTVSGTSFYNEGTGTFGYEIEPQPTEIWSCGEYNPIDGKWHILVQPQGGSIADIALSEPLRKVNDVADTIEFPSSTEGKALVTRNILYYLLENLNLYKHKTEDRYVVNISTLHCVFPTNSLDVPLILCNKYTTVSFSNRLQGDKLITAIKSGGVDYLSVIDSDVTDGSDIQGEILLQLDTPTTELMDAPQIAEADSYSMVISQGSKAVEWSSFETE